MSDFDNEADTIDLDLVSMLESMKNIKSPPNYHAIVKADWESIHTKLKETLVELVKADTLPGISEKYQDGLSLEYNLAMVVDGKMPVKKSTIQDALPDFSNETIMEISKIVFRFDMGRIWGGDSYAAKIKVDVAKRKRTLLCNSKIALSTATKTVLSIQRQP